MHVERLERIFLTVASVMLLGLIGAVLFTSAAGHASLPKPADRVDPAAVRSTPPFDEPGVRDLGGGEYEVVIVASAWAYNPAEIRVPAGATVRFIATSTDVIHGFLIPDTQVNAMLIPGQVTEVTAELDEPGTYTLLCHEYCGIGHHTMTATIIVEGDG